MNTGELKQSMHDRVQGRADRLHRQIEADKLGGEEGRIWLDQFAEEPGGLDICCGDFLIGQACGVDGNERKIGPEWMGPGDVVLPFDSHSQNYIVCNYFDCYHQPLKVLYEWHRVLRSEGKLAIIVPNAEKYNDKMGPLSNRMKSCSYTVKTLRNYLYRAEFEVVSCDEWNSELRMVAIKP